MKKCFRCHEEKDTIDFYISTAYCKACYGKWKKQWREENKKKLSDRQKVLWRRKNNRNCKKCGSEFVGKGRTREYCSTICKIQHHIIRKRNGCWEWKGDLHPNGYAYTTNYETGKKAHIHRISYTLFKGEITKGLYVCHSCDNRKCCNPDHLWVGSAKENMQDAKKKGRLKNQYGVLTIIHPKG